MTTASTPLLRASDVGIWIAFPQRCPAAAHVERPTTLKEDSMFRSLALASTVLAASLTAGGIGWLVLSRATNRGRPAGVAPGGGS